MRAGISRVAVEVILLVLAVALALLIFSPVGSFIFSALGRTQLVGGTTTLEIVGVNIDTNKYIYVKNQGPNTIPQNKIGTNWDVIIKTTEEHALSCGVSLTTDGGTAGDYDPGDVVRLDCTTGWPSDATTTSTFTVIVYGPEGTRTEYIYRP